MDFWKSGQTNNLNEGRKICLTRMLDETDFDAVEVILPLSDAVVDECCCVFETLTEHIDIVIFIY